jgi:hypothetical protein
MHMQVGKKVLKALQKHARVTCGYAAVKVSLEHMEEIAEEHCCEPEPELSCLGGT